MYKGFEGEKRILGADLEYPKQRVYEDNISQTRYRNRVTFCLERYSERTAQLQYHSEHSDKNWHCQS